MTFARRGSSFGVTFNYCAWPRECTSGRERRRLIPYIYIGKVHLPKSAIALFRYRRCWLAAALATGATLCFLFPVQGKKQRHFRALHKGILSSIAAAKTNNLLQKKKFIFLKKKNSQQQQGKPKSNKKCKKKIHCRIQQQYIISVHYIWIAKKKKKVFSSRIDIARYIAVSII